MTKMLKSSAAGADKINRAAELALVQERIRACRLCQEHGYIPCAHPLVSGRADDRIMVIGQAPGHRSVARDLPFSGPGGRILQRWLERAGFPPDYLHEHTYLSSLTHCDPGKNPRGNGDRRPSPPEVALCRQHLAAELRVVNPKVILLVGTMAIEDLLSQYPQPDREHEIDGEPSSARTNAHDLTRKNTPRSRGFTQGKIKLEDVIGTYQERDGRLLLPLPHPSGVSRWLNDAEHQKLLEKALALLAQWRTYYYL